MAELRQQVEDCPQEGQLAGLGGAAPLLVWCLRELPCPLPSYQSLSKSMLTQRLSCCQLGVGHNQKMQSKVNYISISPPKTVKRSGVIELSLINGEFGERLSWKLCLILNVCGPF